MKSGRLAWLAKMICSGFCPICYDIQVLDRIAKEQISFKVRSKLIIRHLVHCITLNKECIFLEILTRSDIINMKSPGGFVITYRLLEAVGSVPVGSLTR